MRHSVILLAILLDCIIWIDLLHHYIFHEKTRVCFGSLPTFIFLLNQIRKFIIGLNGCLQQVCPSNQYTTTTSTVIQLALYTQWYLPQCSIYLSTYVEGLKKVSESAHECEVPACGGQEVAVATCLVSVGDL